MQRSKKDKNTFKNTCLIERRKRTH